MKLKHDIATKCLAATLALFMAIGAISCGADQIIAALQTADQVILSTQRLLLVSNPDIAATAGKVSADLEAIVKTYQDYEAALPSDKPTKADLVRATASAITGNLQQILADVGVKNPALLTEITIGVAVVNSALIIMLNKLPSITTPAARAGIVNLTQLPSLPKAKSAKDLRNAWNNAVSKNHPDAKI